MIDISTLTDLGKKGVNKIKNHFNDLTVDEAGIEFALAACGVSLIADIVGFWNMIDISRLQNDVSSMKTWVYQNDMKNYQNVVINGYAIQAIVDHLSHDYPGLDNAVNMAIRDAHIDFTA